MRTRCERDANEMRKCEEIFRISRHDYAKNSSHFRICFVSASHLIRIWFASLHRPLGAFSSHSSSRFVFPPLWGHFGTNSEHAAYARVALPVGRRSLTANTQRTPTTISISKVTWGDRTRFPTRSSSCRWVQNRAECFSQIVSTQLRRVAYSARGRGLGNVVFKKIIFKIYTMGWASIFRILKRSNKMEA